MFSCTCCYIQKFLILVAVYLKKAIIALASTHDLLEVDLNLIFGCEPLRLHPFA